MPYLWIALGSAVGGMLRHFVASGTAKWIESLAGAPQTLAFVGTIFVNVSGSLAIGAIAAFGPSPLVRQFFMIGLLGGYTTFSSFSLQTLELAHEGRWLHASGNVLLSVVLSIGAVWLGHLCGEALRR